MASLNEIPDHLKSNRTEDFRPGVLLAWGTLATVSLAVVVGGVVCLITRYSPNITHHWLLALAGGFVITQMLFAVMHRIAGIRPDANLVVVAVACSLVVPKYLALLVHVADAQTSPVTLWALFSAMEFFVLNFSTFCGIAFAAILCHNGNFGLEDLLDILMVKPLTGRR